MPASTQKTGDVGVPPIAAETQHDCHTPPCEVKHPHGVRRCIGTEELQEALSNTDRGKVRTRDDRYEQRNRQQLLSTSERPDQAPRSSRGCADTVVSAELRLAARSQEGSGNDDTLAGTTRAASTVPATIKTAIRASGIQTCAGGDSVDKISAPAVLSSAESGSSGNSDGSGGLPASCGFQTRVDSHTGDGTHPRVTGGRHTDRYGTATCGGLLRNRSVAATLTRPKSGRSIGLSSIDYEPGIMAPSSTMLPCPPDAAYFSSRGTEGIARSENLVRKPSTSTSGRDSIGQQVSGSRIIAHNGFQEPPPPPPPGSLSTCSVGGRNRPPRVPESTVSSGSVSSVVVDGGRQGFAPSGGGKGSDKARLTPTPTSSSRSSCRRGRQRDTLEERVSEAFLRRRLQAVGLR